MLETCLFCFILFVNSAVFWWGGENLFPCHCSYFRVAVQRVFVTKCAAVQELWRLASAGRSSQPGVSGICKGRKKTTIWTQAAKTTGYLNFKAPPPPPPACCWTVTVTYSNFIKLLWLSGTVCSCSRKSSSYIKVHLCECTRWAKCKVPSEHRYELWAALATAPLYTSPPNLYVPFLHLCFFGFFYKLVFFLHRTCRAFCWELYEGEYIWGFFLWLNCVFSGPWTQHWLYISLCLCFQPIRKKAIYVVCFYILYTHINVCGCLKYITDMFLFNVNHFPLFWTFSSKAQ